MAYVPNEIFGNNVYLLVFTYILLVLDGFKPCKRKIIISVNCNSKIENGRRYIKVF